MPFSSPTTTSAVNEKRRPPLTTLATRLISTTRSLSSRTSRYSVTLKMPVLPRARRPRALRLRALERLLQLVRARRGERAAGLVVDELRRDSGIRAEHGQARPLG